jgi:hypothetical protein
VLALTQHLWLAKGKAVATRAWKWQKKLMLPRFSDTAVAYRRDTPS